MRAEVRNRRGGRRNLRISFRTELRPFQAEPSRELVGRGGNELPGLRRIGLGAKPVRVGAQPVDAGCGPELHAPLDRLVETTGNLGRALALERCALGVPQDHERVCDQGAHVGSRHFGLDPRRREIRPAGVDRRASLPQDEERKAQRERHLRRLRRCPRAHTGVRQQSRDPGFGDGNGLGHARSRDVRRHVRRAIERLPVGHRDRSSGRRPRRGQNDQHRNATRQAHLARP